jgi:hypothetical protein
VFRLRLNCTCTHTIFFFSSGLIGTRVMIHDCMTMLHIQSRYTVRASFFVIEVVYSKLRKCSSFLIGKHATCTITYYNTQYTHATVRTVRYPQAPSTSVVPMHNHKNTLVKIVVIVRFVVIVIRGTTGQGITRHNETDGSVSMVRNVDWKTGTGTPFPFVNDFLLRFRYLPCAALLPHPRTCSIN